MAGKVYTTTGRAPRVFAAYRRELELVSRVDVEQRVLRGIRTLRAVEDREKRFLTSGSRSSWPDEFERMANALRDARFRGLSNIGLKRLTVTDLDDLHFGPVQDPDRPRQFQPTRQDMNDYLVACEWWAGLARLPSKPQRQRRLVSGEARDIQQKIVERFALAWSWTQIADAERCSDDQVKREYRHAIDDCWRIANGTVKLIDRVEQERKRA